VIMLVFDHHQRDLQARITEIEHRSCSGIISSQHIHLDHHNCLEVVIVKDAPGPGNVVTAEIQSEEITELFTGFGKKGLPAEKVPLQLIDEASEYLAADAPVTRHLANQVMLPMAIAGGGRFRTLSLTPHSTTNIEVIKKFLDIQADVKRVEENTFEVSINKR